MDTSQPSSLPPCRRGPFPAGEQQPGPRRQEAKPLLMLFHRAPPRPPLAAPALPGSEAPPPRLRSAPAGGRGSDSCQRRRRWRRRPSVFAEEKQETDPLALPLPFPALNPPLLVRRDLVPVEFPFHPAAVSSVLGPVEVTALEEEAAAAALASSPPVRCPRSRRGGAAATAAPPPSRCPRAGLGRAAMPSDFISLLSADLDLESPKSLYSRGESGWGLGRGGGEAGPRISRRGPRRGKRPSLARDGVSWGGGERPMGLGDGGRGRGGVAAPPPRSGRPPAAPKPSAPGSLRHQSLWVPRPVRPATLLAANPNLPGSRITWEWARRCGPRDAWGRGSSHQDHPPR